ncbi:MAG: plasmid maintenance protein CcdB [Burkholderiales bacterium RIFCSPHIGHO2_12_FULL_69_20]|nr:MAG: plasmid maintenance protein CcdB [Burkholderiales bacterium RIFCSPHIGHO2_12_FULL_69_20]
MARFDIFANPFAAERVHTPFVLDVQNDHLGPLATRIVIPLRAPGSYGRQATGLNPLLDVNGMAVVLDTAALAPVPASLLKQPVCRADTRRDDVLDALDTLFGSY